MDYLPVETHHGTDHAMTITLYGIRHCDTMKTARAWLDVRGVAYAFHDDKVAGIEPATLSEQASSIGWGTAGGFQCGDQRGGAAVIIRTPCLCASTSSSRPRCRRTIHLGQYRAPRRANL